MATPPTFVAEYESAWDGHSGTFDATASVTVANGDLLVVLAATEDSSKTLSTPTGGGLTYSLRTSVVVGSSCTAYIWTAPSTSGQTFTLTTTASSSGTFHGFSALRFADHTGVGANPTSANSASGAPSLSITNSGDNSAICAINADWNASDGTTRTWRTVNSITPTAGNNLERVYFRDSSHYTTYAAYWNDAGAAGAKTVGLSAPTGQAYSLAAVEILGTASATPNPRPPVVAPSRAAIQASTW